MAREEDITILNQTDLKYLLIDSLKIYSQDIEYLSGDNPYLFNVNKRPIYILIKNLHDSGKGRVNKDESRIQIAKTHNFLAAKNSGKPVLIFGYSKKDNTFTAWNPFMFMERINRKKTISLYSRFSTQEKAIKNEISLYKDNNGQRIISFKPGYLGLYLENYSQMHQSDEEILVKLVKKSEETRDTKDKSIEINVDGKRFTVTHKVFKRSFMFKKIIHQIYDYRCAICGIQLEVIQAAHIVPRSDKKGNDDFRNGICLCTLHHAAYDGGLIYFNEDFSIKINKEKVRYLEKIKRDGGLNKFTELQFDKLSLPSSKQFYPFKDYIKIANKIRGISNE